MEDNLASHEALRLVRVRKGLSQSDVADKIGISQNAYSKIERGVTTLTIDRIRQLSTILEVDTDELLGLDDNFNNQNMDLKASKEYELSFFRIKYEQSQKELSTITREYDNIEFELESKKVEIQDKKEIIELLRKNNELLKSQNETLKTEISKREKTIIELKEVITINGLFESALPLKKGKNE